MRAGDGVRLASSLLHLAYPDLNGGGCRSEYVFGGSHLPFNLRRGRGIGKDRMRK